jgi:hypothetical protein
VSRRPLAVLIWSGAVGTALSWFVAQHSLLGARWKLFLPIAAWLIVWLAGGWSAVRVPSRRAALVTIVVLAAALRVAAASGTTPSISNDLYRYGWDAHVQLSGLDPYRYPPSAAQLGPLRTPPFFPTQAGCARIGKQPGCTTMNRPAERTIYPPVAEAWFDVISVAVPGGHVRQWQLAGAAVDLAAIGLLMVGLRRLGRDPTEAAWYALCPIPVVEFAGNGHVDGLGLVLLLAALLALQRSRRAAAGLLIGLAIMVKLYPGVAAIACWKKGRWPMALTAGAVCLAAYAPHVAAVGARVVGYLPGYMKEEHYSNAARFLLLDLLPLPGQVITGLALILFAAAALVVVRADLRPATGLAVLLTVTVVLTSPVQPWYAAGLAGIGILVRAPWLVTLALLAEVYYAAVILADPHQVAIGRLCYGAALLVMVAGVVLAHRRGRPNRAGGPGAGRRDLTASTMAAGSKRVV